MRAGDEQHVYLRVDWMYRPEDLPGGRRPYHGQNELIASNEMQILDATSVEGKANVKQWVEQDDKNETLDADQLFWRQTLECSKPRAKKLSVRSAFQPSVVPALTKVNRNCPSIALIKHPATPINFLSSAQLATNGCMARALNKPLSAKPTSPTRLPTRTRTWLLSRKVKRNPPKESLPGGQWFKRASQGSLGSLLLAWNIKCPPTCCSAPRSSTKAIE